MITQNGPVFQSGLRLSSFCTSQGRDSLGRFHDSYLRGQFEHRSPSGIAARTIHLLRPCAYNRNPMLLILPLVAFITNLASHVHGHGYISKVVIDGTVYSGNAPGHDTVTSPIRMVAAVIPVTNVSSADLACGYGAVDAPMDAPAFPGSTVNLTWVSGGGGNWPHEVGPVLTYMASCLNAITCAGFNASAARWFKIAEDAKQADSTSWVQQLIMEGDNYNVTIPGGLEPGAYLIRNELLSLQNAMALGGAEFYPSCTQVRIQGNGTGVPVSNSTVTFPGAYNATDPGILVDAYTDPDKPYEIPGPPLATFVGATSETNGTSPSPTSPSSSKTDDVPPNSAQSRSALPQSQVLTSSSTGPIGPVASSSSEPVAPTSPHQAPSATLSRPAQAAAPTVKPQVWIPVVDATPLQPELVERRQRQGHSRVMGRMRH
ncbi:lytic polysaccharide monooxygenase [Daedalea quercina L-15889]|uniref:lytic cellulose monooxygenase (C4-dehydrogenating) n=1 Tax=Daedalea quercina L-15889 TaxID=1314783 RepID=A0A165NG13_9APHY|nr:lytic polysaccharide monooxygenase [Daedalea quercina L-15889]